MTKTLIHTDGHYKFYDIRIIEAKKNTEPTCVRIQFGRIGTKGQVQVKTFDSEFTAENFFFNMVSQKLDKGYKVVVL